MKYNYKTNGVEARAEILYQVEKSLGGPWIRYSEENGWRLSHYGKGFHGKGVTFLEALISYFGSQKK